MNNDVIYNDCKEIISHSDLNMLTGKTILITGATGLIGTYLLFSLREFINRGGTVKAVYIVVHSGLPEHLKELMSFTWMNILFGDLTDDNFLKEIPHADYIIHAAGYGQPAKFVINADKTIKLNTYVLFKMFDRINENGKLLFISSSGIYNGLNKDYFDETDVGTTNTLHPRACYIEGKRCGETICNAYRMKGIHATSVRLSYIYGPGIRWDDERALYSFIKKGFKKKIDLLDDGSAQRIYCYVTDAIEVIWKILIYGREPIYNLGGTDKVTIKELAEMIAERLKAEVVLQEKKNGIDGSAAVERLNIDKIRIEFDKTEFVNIDEGLTRTIQWIKDNYVT